MKLNGIAHIYITVQNFEACLPFYERLLPYFDMQCLVRSDALYYCVGSRTGIGIRAAGKEHEKTTFDQYRAGLHHICLRAYERNHIDEIHEFVVSIGARVIHPPREDDWAPGYYSLLFEDPCGTRIEVNHVPGKGNLASDVSLPLGNDRQSALSEP